MQVHFQQSVKRVCEWVNKHEAGYRAFTTIGYNIPKVDTPEKVQALFAVLAGEEPLHLRDEDGGPPDKHNYVRYVCDL